MQRNWTISTAVMVLASILVCPEIRAGDVEDKVKAAMTQLGAKAQGCKAAIKDALGTPFEQQITKAMDELKRDPRALHLQLQVIDVLIAQDDRLTDSLHGAADADLGALRDKVVTGLEAIQASKAAERDQYTSRAKETADDAWRKRYEDLAQVCDRLARAYSLRAEEYRSVPIKQQLLTVQVSIEYLQSVKAVLSSLREDLGNILQEEAALHELQRMAITVDDVQKSLNKFSEVVLAGTLTGEQPTKSVEHGQQAQSPQKAS